MGKPGVFGVGDLVNILQCKKSICILKIVKNCATLQTWWLKLVPP
jgi:hypothetical protein